MSSPLDALPPPLKELAAGWAGYAALGSFVLYLLGYLSLRFHLMSFGITADLAVLERALPVRRLRASWSTWRRRCPAWC